jgi:2-polyprenyl-3-methyl-5-hydroxy-6-metoxy-1,4-benzoquinol methylase
MRTSGRQSPEGKEIGSCRVCGAKDLARVIDLGQQPWCNHFLKGEECGLEPFYPLRVAYCRGCATAQLDYTVPKEVMFADHTYLSGTTRTLSDHFRTLASYVDNRFFAATTGKSALDIGSNDGTQLRHYQALGYDVLGVDSSKTATRIANDLGVPTIRTFFNLDVAQDLKRKFHVVNAAGVFFHLEELHSVAEAIREVLIAEGVFVVQFLYMKSIIDNGAFDQIYHEHLLYYNLVTIEVLLNRHGLGLFDAFLSPIHGGSIIGFACRRGERESAPRLSALRRAEDAAGANDIATYLGFADRIKGFRTDNLTNLREAKTQGKRIFGFGAPAKGNTLLNYFGIGTDILDCLVEKNELRRGLFSPGMHIPIVLERELTEVPDIFYVLAWNFREEILQNNRHLLESGVEFRFPVIPRAAAA